MFIVIKEMELKPNVGSDRSWVYTAHDYSEGEPTTELLAVRLANAENAKLFKEKFEEAQAINTVNKDKSLTKELDKEEQNDKESKEKNNDLTSQRDKSEKTPKGQIKE